MNFLEERIVKDGIAKGHFSEKEYYTDNVHPTIQGHTLMSDCLMNLVATVDKAKIDEKIEVPTKNFARMGLSGLKRIYDDDKNVKISKGSFTDVPMKIKSGKTPLLIPTSKTIPCNPSGPEIPAKGMLASSAPKPMGSRSRGSNSLAMAR